MLLLNDSEVCGEHALQRPELTVSQVPVLVSLEHLAHELFLLRIQSACVVDDWLMCNEVLLRFSREQFILLAARSANHVTVLQLGQEAIVLCEHDLFDQVVVLHHL